MSANLSSAPPSTTLALDGGTPVRRAPFPSWPEWDERDERALLEVLRSGKWGSSAGSRVTEFQTRFAAFQDAAHGVAVTNGTAALEVALRAVGVQPLDEVIVPPYTFVASATAVLAIGAMPVFCDILPDTYLIDAADAARRVTPRTKAIVAVHIGGQPADMDAVLEVAQRHQLKVVEDAAQAHGASWRGRRVGAIGDAGTFSFQSSKNLNAGEGGIVLSNDRALAERAWSLANVGRVPQGAWYQHELMGFNLRLTEFQGALLLSQMERLPQQFEHRERNARYLDLALAQVPGITPQARDERVTGHAHHLYLFRYDERAFGGRDRAWFLRALRAEGIPCSPGYTTPLYRMKAVIDERRKWAALAQAAGRAVDLPDSPDAEALPVTERACAGEGVWLTQSVLLGTEADMAQIVEAVAKVQRAASGG
ncbi:MAG TPA: DegT/DnrJ/EryC1/StrS family aminotransferase [Chloroflexota bacterium]|jgi:dTDP-4-amino-4,6-dideoxygalactose transaminase|nr:DegT/DnrJ/EryC1/StrS family aminotransferase [Chloroflexota bacterium]